MHSPQAVEVANKSLSFRSIPIHDATPTGTQLALAAGYTHNQSVLVFQIVESGLLEDIRPEESADLSRGRKFIIEEGDRAYRLKINSLTFDWPARQISREQIRFLGNIAAEDEVLLTRIDQPDKVIGDHEQVYLGKPETEAFISHKASWKLNVQGVVREYQVPVVTVRDAMVNAGFDPDAGWIIHLKIQGKPNLKVMLDYPVDLRTPGVEKIRLTARDVDNGEAPSAPHRDFALLPADIEHLDSLGLRWEALVEGQQRWLIVQDFPLPSGYTTGEGGHRAADSADVPGCADRHVLRLSGGASRVRSRYPEYGVPRPNRRPRVRALVAAP